VDILRGDYSNDRTLEKHANSCLAWSIVALIHTPKEKQKQVPECEFRLSIVGTMMKLQTLMKLQKKTIA
jgi:hypothetical protein